MLLTDRAYASIFLNIAALFILAGIVINTAIYRKRNRIEDRVFFLFLIDDMFIAVFDAAVAVCNHQTFPGASVLNLVCMGGFYISVAVFCYLILIYMISRVWNKAEIVRKIEILLGIPILAVVLMYVIGVPNHLFIAVDETNSYYYASFYRLPVLIMTTYAVTAYVLAFVYRLRKRGQKYIPMVLYLLPFVAGGISTYVFHGISMTAIGLAVTFCYMHMGVMNEKFFGASEEGEEGSHV